MDVTLLYPDIGEVGSGFILEAQPAGIWLGVCYPDDIQEYVLLRPSGIFPEFNTLPLHPRQLGISVIGQALDKTVLWKVVDLMIPSGDPPMDEDVANADCPFLARSQWVGHEILKKAENGRVVASGRVNCCFPTDHFQDSTLGDGFVGVTVLQVMDGDVMTIMTHQKWPIS